MRNKLDKKLIIGFTTDPYQNIYGYSLVFFRLFDLLDRKYPKTDIIFLANNGTCSSIVNNKKFNIFKLNKNLNPVFKTILLVMNFVAKIIKYDNKVILVSNGEIPELITASLLGLKFKQTYCIIQDLRIRENSMYHRFIGLLRVFLLRNFIKNIIFTNKFTMNQYRYKVNKYYIGNPVF